MPLNRPDSIKYLKKIAIKSALSNKIDDFIDKCYRYYSKTYNTPLKESYDLLPEEVILIYYKDQLETFKKEELLEEMDKLDLSEKPVLVTDFDEENDDDMDEDAWIAQEEAKLKQEEDEATKKATLDVMAKTHAAIEELTRKLKESNTKKIKEPDSEEMNLEYED